MDWSALYAALLSDPLYFIGIFFALWGALGFGTFMRGFADGVPHLFTYGESDTHMEHSRVSAVHGLYLSMTALGAWEIVRVVVGQAPWGYLWLSAVMLVPWWVPLLRKLAAGGKGSKGSH